jgi:ectoine hydroxylase-related dioxygenase (phytanoyl-CoA dioxygenase family)
MFALGSALEGTGPPAEWNNLSMVDEVPSGPGLAYRRVDGVDPLPSSTDDGRGKARRAEQLEGSPGTAILYDARTWHRQHANLSDKPRTALLFVYTPRWVLPMGDQAQLYADMTANMDGNTQREQQLLRHYLGDRK